MIYLSDFRVAYTEESSLIDDLSFPQKVNWFPDTFNKVKTGLFYPPHKMAEKVLDPELIKSIRENPVGKTAFILASGSANFAGINPRKIKDNALTYEYRFLPMTLTNVYAGSIAQKFGDIDYVATDATACASGLKVLMDVQTLIRMYGFNRVIVLAIEDQINNSIIDFFGQSKASLSIEDEENGIMPSAFDSKNYGFHVGQGACLAVFDRHNVCKEPKAALLGAYTSSESCSNAIGQTEDGKGFKTAIKGAMEFSDIGSKSIKLIKTHGTGTKSNNKAEKTAIESIFSNFIATSYKPRIGHTMGVSGLLETCLLVQDIGNGIVPKIVNRTEEDDVYLSHDAEVPKGNFLSLAAGMGNVYSAAVLTTEI